jgi:DNA repair protein RadC
VDSNEERQNVSDADAFSDKREVFLYKLAQLQDKDRNRFRILHQDSQNFLQVTKPF